MKFERKERLRLEAAAAAGPSLGGESRAITIHVHLHRETRATDRHPLQHPHAVELMTAHRVRRLRAQSASRTSDTFPDRSSLHTATGPSGIFVTAEFVVDKENDDEQDEDQVKRNFLALLRELVGTRRVLIAPLGSSMENHRLYRHIHVEGKTKGNSAAVVVVSTVLSLDNTQFSTEALRSFLPRPPPERNDAGSSLLTVASASAWSHWFLGGPQSLDEARVSLKSDPRQETTIAGPNPQRRSLWMDWTASDGCFLRRQRQQQDGESNGLSDECEIQTQQGIQYSINSGLSAGNRIALQNLLPGDEAILQPDPFADETSIELNGLSWNCHEALDPFQKNILLTEPLNLTQGCLSLADDATAEATSADPFWSVESHLWRSAGQANGGAWDVVLRNDHTSCAAQVAVQQTIPRVMEPVWQSLMVVAGFADGAERILRWDQLVERDVQFRKDGSILLTFQHTLPRQSALEVVFNYEPLFLNIDNFPGDANRGFELPPIRAQFRVELDGSDACDRLLDSTQQPDGSFAVDLYSNSLLLLAPLPDMRLYSLKYAFQCHFADVYAVCFRRGFAHQFAGEEGQQPSDGGYVCVNCQRIRALDSSGRRFSLLFLAGSSAYMPRFFSTSLPRLPALDPSKAKSEGLLARIMLRLKQRFLAVTGRDADETERDDD